MCFTRQKPFWKNRNQYPDQVSPRSSLKWSEANNRIIITVAVSNQYNVFLFSFFLLNKSCSVVQSALNSLILLPQPPEIMGIPSHTRVGVLLCFVLPHDIPRKQRPAGWNRTVQKSLQIPHWNAQAETGKGLRGKIDWYEEDFCKQAALPKVTSCWYLKSQHSRALDLYVDMCRKFPIVSWRRTLVFVWEAWALMHRAMLPPTATDGDW